MRLWLGRSGTAGSPVIRRFGLVAFHVWKHHKRAQPRRPHRRFVQLRDQGVAPSDPVRYRGPARRIQVPCYSWRSADRGVGVLKVASRCSRLPQGDPMHTPTPNPSPDRRHRWTPTSLLSRTGFRSRTLAPGSRCGLNGDGFPTRGVLGRRRARRECRPISGSVWARMTTARSVPGRIGHPFPTGNRGSTRAPGSQSATSAGRAAGPARLQGGRRPERRERRLYRIGWDLDAGGQVSGWSPWFACRTGSHGQRGCGHHGRRRRRRR